MLSRGLNDFVAKKGALAGIRNYAYYAAYVFFEKVRIGGEAKEQGSACDGEEVAAGGGYRGGLYKGLVGGGEEGVCS